MGTTKVANSAKKMKGVSGTPRLDKKAKNVAVKKRPEPVVDAVASSSSEEEDEVVVQKPVKVSTKKQKNVVVKEVVKTQSDVVNKKQKKEIVAKKQGVAAKKQEVAVKKQEAAAKKQEVAAKKQEAVVKKQEIVAKKIGKNKAQVKKVVESSDEASSEDSSNEASSDEGSSDGEVAVAPVQEDDDSSDDSSSGDEDAVVAKAHASSDDESSSESDEDVDAVAASMQDESDDDDDESDENAESDENVESEESAGSDEDSESDGEEEVKPASKKRPQDVVDGPPAKKAKTQESTENKVFVGGLSYEADEDDLRQVFGECGTITSIRIPVFEDSGKKRGIAFIDFEEADAVEKACTKDGSEIRGRWIKVNASHKPAPDSRGAKPSQRERGPKPQDCKTIFVGNLSFQADEFAISKVFESCGDIVSVRIATDRESGQPRGFGYVEFTSTDAVDAAVAKTGTNISGREIRVDFAADRDSSNKSDGGFRGGRGGFRGGRGGGRGAARGGQQRGGFRGKKTMF